MSNAESALTVSQLVQPGQPLKPLACLQDELERMAVVAGDLSRLVVEKVDGILGAQPQTTGVHGCPVLGRHSTPSFVDLSQDATKRIRIAMRTINEEISRL